MGPSAKFALPNKNLISKKEKIGVNFFPEKRLYWGGGLAKDHTCSRFFLNPSLRGYQIKSNLLVSKTSFVRKQKSGNSFYSILV